MKERKKKKFFYIYIYIIYIYMYVCVYTYIIFKKGLRKKREPFTRLVFTFCIFFFILRDRDQFFFSSRIFFFHVILQEEMQIGTNDILRFFFFLFFCFISRGVEEGESLFNTNVCEWRRLRPGGENRFVGEKKIFFFFLWIFFFHIASCTHDEFFFIQYVCIYITWGMRLHILKWLMNIFLR